MVESGIIKKSRSVVLLLVLVSSLAVWALVLVDQAQVDGRVQQLVAQQSERLESRVELFRAGLERALYGLEALAGVSSAGGAGEVDAALNQAALVVMASNPTLYRIRQVDEAGKERFRLERTTNGLVPMLVSEPQHGATSADFERVLELQPGQFFMSDLDLSDDGDKLETPFPPSLRLARRLPGNAGFIMINVDVGALLASLRLATGAEPGSFWLADRAGQWLQSADLDRSRPPGAEPTIVESLPKATVDSILSSARGALSSIMLPSGGLVLSRHLAAGAWWPQLVMSDDIVFVQHYRPEYLAGATKLAGRLPVLLLAGLTGALALLAFFALRQGHLQRQGVSSSPAADAPSRTAFLAHLSHSIRTPMTVILGMLALLKDTPLNASQTKLAGKAYGASERLLGILNDIMEVSRLEAHEVKVTRKPFALEELIEVSVDTFSAIAEDKGIALSVQVVPTAPVRLSGDLLRLGQIVSQLVSNAIKFSVAGDRIEVTFSLRDHADGAVALCVQVQDSGSGMSADQLALVSEAFFNAGNDKPFSGMGLGLTIAARLTGLLNGTMAVASEEHQGACFTLEVPVKPIAGAEPVGLVAEPALLPSFSGLNVLVVDDLELNIEVISGLLRKLGIVAMEASSGEQAVETVAHHPVDVVLMDVHMLGMSGLKATQLIRHRADLRQPLIFGLSASAMALDREAALTAGMDEYLSKPLMLTDFVSLLEKHRFAPVDQLENTAPAPVFCEAWPFPSFINRASWQSRFGGNVELLARCLSNFVTSFEAFPSSLESAERSGDVPAAHGLVHKVLGAARNLGDDRLAECASTAESGLEAASWQSVQAVKGLITERLKELRAWSHTSFSVASMSDEMPQKVTGDVLRRGVRALRANKYLCEADRVILLQHFSDLGGSEQVEEMKEALDSFDYSRANTLLNELTVD